MVSLIKITFNEVKMQFLDDKILLESDLAIKIYNNYAKNLPIIDFHCHIDQRQILKGKKFKNITELWLGGDHYKWRLMRNFGIDEKYITGNASDREKFKAFCKMLPTAIGNPIYIWCHLELRKYFNITLPICEENADHIFDKTKIMLGKDEFSAPSIIEKSNVKVICTTDDPIDDLAAHYKLKGKHPFKVLPTFRPDKALNIKQQSFKDYIKSLEKICQTQITSIEKLKGALEKRLDFFVQNGCLISDHALEGYTYLEATDKEVDDIFKKALSGESLSKNDVEKYKTYVLLFLAKLYAKKDVVMQLHLNCLRNNFDKMYEKIGADSGFDCINQSKDAYKLSKFLNSLANLDLLPKTIIYSLDANDDKIINTILGCFQGKLRGKLQNGAPWWFNDTEIGIKTHFKTLAEYSLLGNFVGMLTDSRSFTSYVRHDFFRRILCTFIADQINLGKYPNDEKNIKALVQNICYKNIQNYLNLKID